MKPLPELIAKDPVRISSNPLRIGEPKRSYGAQTHIWGDQPEPEKLEDLAAFLKAKEIQNIAICLDDIVHLMSLLQFTKNATDYTNKLIGKYIILEVQNIASCFNSLARVSIDFKRVAQALNKELKAMDKKFKFKDIRNKLAAHRHEDRNGTINLPLTDQIDLWRRITYEAITAYHEVIYNHLMSLKPLAPFEFKIYVEINHVPINAIDVQLVEDYVPFYSYSPKQADGGEL